ncbi:MAG: hypothetical protein ABIG20_03365 [archaeon]
MDFDKFLADLESRSPELHRKKVRVEVEFNQTERIAVRRGQMLLSCKNAIFEGYFINKLPKGAKGLPSFSYIPKKDWICFILFKKNTRESVESRELEVEIYFRREIFSKTYKEIKITLLS